MKATAAKYKAYLTNKKFLISLISGIVFLLLSFVVNFYAGTYATEKASNFVSDIILSNIPLFNVDWLFVWGPVIFWIFISLLCIYDPKKGPFILKSVALFMVIRSVFITMTHIGPFPDQLELTTGISIAKDFTFGADLFFSAHTGLPFLMALVFHKNKVFRNLFICVSIFFGIIVLMAHRHYTIDVLSAFFITYSIYHIARLIFKNEAKMFDEGTTV